MLWAVELCLPSSSVLSRSPMHRNVGLDPSIPRRRAPDVNTNKGKHRWEEDTDKTKSKEQTNSIPNLTMLRSLDGDADVATDLECNWRSVAPERWRTRSRRGRFALPEALGRVATLCRALRAYRADSMNQDESRVCQPSGVNGDGGVARQGGFQRIRQLP